MKFVIAVGTTIKNLAKQDESLKQVLEAQSKSKSLSLLINLILEDLTEETMTKFMALIKRQTHSRDDNIEEKTKMEI